MDPQSHGPQAPRPEPERRSDDAFPHRSSEGSIEDSLLRWDSLGPDELAALEAEPSAAARLEQLRAAETWLRSGRARPRAAGGGRTGRPVPILDAPGFETAGFETAGTGREHDCPAEATVGVRCPTADELYEYGRGPGYVGLSAARRAALDRLLPHCGSCTAMVAGLATPPPLPLDVEGARDADEPPAEPGVEPGAEPPRSVPRPRLLRWPVRVAAAAAVLVLGGLWAWRAAGVVEGAPDFPAPVALRGAEDVALRFPRGPVLAGADAPWRAAGAAFELAPVADATRYRVAVHPAGTDPFELGEPLWEGAADSPRVPAPELAPGRYTWSAWAEVQGLPRPLGERDFEVVAGAPAELAAPHAAGEAATLRRLRALHEAGFLTDARALARGLSPSEARDAYLESLAGR